MAWFKETVQHKMAMKYTIEYIEIHSSLVGHNRDRKRTTVSYCAPETQYSD